MNDRLTTAEFTDREIRVHRLCGSSRMWRMHCYQVELHEKIKVFEAVVWFPRLQAQIEATNSRGMTADLRGIKLMTWCCAGRCLIQMERDGHRVTLITADDEKPWVREMAHRWPSMGPMGLQSIDADYEAAMVMLYEVTRYGGEIVLSPSDEVTIGG